MRRRLFLFVFVLIAPASSSLGQSGFYKADGTDILNPDGDPIVMKGIGLGGWLMPEGYMLHISAPDGGSPRTIRSQIQDLIGAADTDRFYELFRENYVEEKDIAQIAEWGFDHIRLPFHYKILFDPDTQTFIESGFDVINTFLDWCRTYNLAVILDMHAAPGAQSAFNISDSDGVARLWTEPVPYQDQTVAIWTEIARRYADETLIVGYDLINEPVTPDGVTGQDLRDLYVRITQAIRTVDTNHIVFIEGNYFATDFPFLTPPFDANMAYSFHKYWNAVDVGTINYLLQLRSVHDTPLWMGETGENSNAWFYYVRTLFEQYNIGWNWWTHKKIETTTSPLSAPFAPGYEAVLDYWRGNGPRPAREDARDALFAMAEGLDMDSCVVRQGVIASLFDQDFNSVNKPYTDLTIPGTINPVDYDLGNQGIAYSDNDYMATSGAPGGGNNGGAYRNDGVDIQLSSDPFGFKYNVGWTEPGEWLLYTVDIETEGTYDIELRVASGVGGGQLSLFLDDTEIGATGIIGNSGGYQNWISTWIRGVSLPEGLHQLKLQVESAGFNLNTLYFTLKSGSDPENPSNVPFFASIAGSYPNPASDLVTIRFETDVSGTGTIHLFDTLGRELGYESQFAFTPGTNAIPLRLNVESGIYFYRLNLDSGTGRRSFDERLVITR